jgi:glycosyltransferase involved in cell wall biosynthesis
LNPGRVRVISNEKNMGMHKNADQVLKACRGEYVAYLEGDDYWTSPKKLQTQADFLDSHPECPMCYHGVEVVYKGVSDEHLILFFAPKHKEFLGVADLLALDIPIETCSTMFRTSVCAELPDWIDSLKMRDWPTVILAALHGEIAYINEVMAAYVVHPEGMWFSYGQCWEKEQKARIDLWEALRAHLGPKYRGLLDRILRYQFLMMSNKYETSGNLANARAYIMKSLVKHAAISTEILRRGGRPLLAASMPDRIKFFSRKELIKTALRTYAPGLYKSLGCVSKHLKRGE